MFRMGTSKQTDAPMARDTEDEALHFPDVPGTTVAYPCWGPLRKQAKFLLCTEQ
jgi:hypothetical protein